MNGPLSLVAVILCFYIFLKTYWIWWINDARRKGLYPERGKATMFDVRRFVVEGQKELAIRVYREIIKSNYKDAKKAVEELEKSIQQKHFKIG